MTVKMNKQKFLINQKNITRGIHAIFPPKMKKLERYYANGVHDATAFLIVEGFYCENGLQNASCLSTEGASCEEETEEESVSLDSKLDDKSTQDSVRTQSSSESAQVKITEF